MIKMEKINLTYHIHEGMFKYPSDCEVEVEKIKARSEKINENVYSEDGTLLMRTQREKYFSGRIKIFITNHHGTHIDAPAHKIPAGKTINRYDKEKFTNNCILLDLTSTDLLERKEREITKEDLRGLERILEQPLTISNVNSLVLYTGFCDEMSKNELYTGFCDEMSKNEKRKFEQTFPFLSIETAEYIYSINKNLNILGIDSFSFDRTGSNSEVHRFFLSEDILLLETLFNLRELSTKLSKKSNKNFELQCYPSEIFLNLEADAAPTEAIAVIP